MDSTTLAIIILIVTGLIGIGSILAITEIKREQLIKNSREELEKKTAKIYWVHNFYAQHPEVWSLSQTVDREWNALLRYSSTSLLDYNPLPKAPTYTQGLYKGSLGDNVSVIANAQKKADYENAMTRYYENLSRKHQAERETEETAKRLYTACENLIAVLVRIPGSNELIDDAIKKRDYARQYFK